MDTTREHEGVIDGMHALENLRRPSLLTLSPLLDTILSCDARDSPVTAGRAGLVPGILHLLAGPQGFLSTILMRAAVSAQRPPVEGGIDATWVHYIELNNDFDPYVISKIAQEKRLTPSRVLGRIEISRGFNWDQAVEIIGRYLPARVKSRSIVLISGITTWFDPASQEHYRGLREMIHGLKQCFHEKHVYMLATAPVADGSTFKPKGGNNLTHFAGVVATFSCKQLNSGSIVTTCELVQHPFLPRRVRESWDHSGNRKARMARGSSLRFTTLEEFL
ncbi:hypothetical protein GF325_17845 [Candidatus Bathyarchaeota archaeon]|nr:hypothetical protein [Candidatus Bathyarchaeota archaeon]